MLLSFLLFVTPGSALMFFIFRFIKANQTISVAHKDTARARARMEAAQEATAVAQGTARQALTHVGDALEVARTIELVHENVQNLTEYFVTQIEGEAPPRRASGRHSRPGVPAGDSVPEITSGETQEEEVAS